MAALEYLAIAAGYRPLPLLARELWRFLDAMQGNVVCPAEDGKHCAIIEKIDRIIPPFAVRHLEPVDAQNLIEFPAVEGVPLAENVAALGAFKADAVNLSDVAANIPEAQKIFNEVGWK